MAINNDWLVLLRKKSLFSSFTGKELNLVAKKMTLMSFPKGAVLIHDQEPGHTFYLIVSGSVRLFKKNDGAKSHPSAEQTLTFVSRGDALGEMSLLTGEPYPYSARIESTADVLALKKKDFDEILERNPTLAVHVSRVLSNHLALLNQTENRPPAPGRLIGLASALSPRDLVLFGVNLGVSLLEQTRERCLLVAVDDGSSLASKSLRLDTPILTEALIQDGCFNDVNKFNNVISVHPSGLEVLTLPEKTFYGLTAPKLNSLMALIRDQYDYALFLLPPHFNEITSTLLNDCTQVAFVSSPQSRSQDLNFLRQAQQSLPYTKPKDHIWLSTRPNGVPATISPGNRIPWKEEWGRDFMIQGSPFIPLKHKPTQRKLDRLARYYGQRLVGFAMGSGAAFGYALIGMLRVMEREGIYPDMVSGTSMGGLIGAFYCVGLTPDEMEEIAVSITKKRLWKMIQLAFPRSGLLTGKGILQFVRSHVGEKTFRDLEIPFATVATDIQTGREIIIDEGSVAEAVRASLSLPFFFQPYYSNGRYLVDGGLVNPVPISVNLAQGANILISANLTSKAGEKNAPPRLGWTSKLPPALRGPNLPEILLKTIYTMQFEISEARSKMAHVVLDVNAKGLWWWDLDHATEIIRLGEASMEENLPKIKSLLPFFANSCKVKINRRGRKIY